MTSTAQTGVRYTARAGEAMASTAGPEGATVGYSCEEWNGEYLLINEAAAAAAYPNSTNNVAVEVQDSMTVHCGSLDSGYEGKMSRTCSPSDAEGKENQTPAAQVGCVCGFVHKLLEPVEILFYLYVVTGVCTMWVPVTTHK